MVFVKSAVVVWAPVLVYFQFVTGKREWVPWGEGVGEETMH